MPTVVAKAASTANGIDDPARASTGHLVVVISPDMVSLRPNTWGRFGVFPPGPTMRRPCLNQCQVIVVEASDDRTARASESARHAAGCSRRRRFPGGGPGCA